MKLCRFLFFISLINFSCSLTTLIHLSLIHDFSHTKLFKFFSKKKFYSKKKNKIQAQKLKFDNNFEHVARFQKQTFITWNLRRDHWCEIFDLKMNFHSKTFDQKNSWPKLHLAFSSINKTTTTTTWTHSTVENSYVSQKRERVKNWKIKFLTKNKSSRAEQ